MSFSLRVTNRYKKDFKKKQYNLSDDHKRKLKTAIIKLSENLDLPKEYKDHALTGDLHNYRECHIAPNLLLLYSESDPNKIKDGKPDLGGFRLWKKQSNKLRNPLSIKEGGDFIAKTSSNKETQYTKDELLDGKKEAVFYLETVGFIRVLQKKCITIKLIPKKDTSKHLPIYEDIVKVSPMKVNLKISNGGSDLDNGEHKGAQGSLVLAKNEEDIGAYLLVNWDDDNGIYNNLEVEPKPDIEDSGIVLNEDNLANLNIEVNLGNGLPNKGTIILEVIQENQRIKFWKKSTKETEFVLSSNKYFWDLSNHNKRNEFKDLMYSEGLWIEGIKESELEKDIEIKLIYQQEGVSNIEDIVKVTVVMLRLGAGTVRENTLAWFTSERGHTALITRYIGNCIREELMNDESYEQMEMASPTGGPLTNLLTNATNNQNTGRFNPTIEFYGITEPNSFTYVQRLKIIKTARYLATHGSHIWYTGLDAVEPDGFSWTGNTIAERITDLDALRCDGFLELCYELNNVNAWGHIKNGSINYSIVNNLDEHNIFVLFEWGKYLQPVTQGSINIIYRGVNWNSTLDIQTSKTKPVIE